jgi:hypothetical protein
MRRTLHNIVVGLLVFSARAHCQLPKDFHWVDLRREAETISRVSQATLPPPLFPSLPSIRRRQIFDEVSDSLRLRHIHIGAAFNLHHR